jgi:hypothetical protein
MGFAVLYPSYALRSNHPPDPASWIADSTRLNVRVLLQPFYNIESIPATKRTMPSSILAAIRSLNAASMIAVNAISKMYAASFAVPSLINVMTFFQMSYSTAPGVALLELAMARRMGGAKRYPSGLRAMIDGYRCAPSFLRTGCATVV